MSGIYDAAISGSILILILACFRLLLGKTLPKALFPALWCAAAIRLLLPVALPSPLSIWNLASNRVQTAAGVQIAAQITPFSAASAAKAAADTGKAAVQLQWPILIWAISAVLLAGYLLIGFLRFHRRFSKAAPAGSPMIDEIMQQFHFRRLPVIRTASCGLAPLTYGCIRPVVLLPAELLTDADALRMIRTHELAHIRRRDCLRKLLFSVCLCVYWWNPACWLMIVLANRDIELACDERVVRDMTREDRAAYSQALLQCSLNRRRRLVLCPLAFGEVGVRTRVKSVLRYRRPAVWLSAAAVLLCAALAVTFLTEPKTAENSPAEKARTHNNDYVDYFQRIQKKEAQQGRSVDNPVVIISTSMEPATGQISYQVQLLDGMTDWEKERILSRYNMNIANMEIFYPQEGDIYQEMDVPHLRFRAVSSTFAPPIDPAYDDLVALDNPYEPYTLASVTVLSADGSQSSTFRRVGQSLLLDDAPDDSGRSAISWSIRID